MTFVSVDLGASSGRVMSLSGSELTQIHRFENRPVRTDGRLTWDYRELLKGIKTGIGKTDNSYESIGIDTWGVDFAVVCGDKVIYPPAHYRDELTQGIMPKVFAVAGKRELYEQTGVFPAEINTIFQLFALRTIRPDIFTSENKILLMPDFFRWLLSGKDENTIAAEISIASTTGLLDPFTKDWHWELIDKLGFPPGMFPPVSPPAPVTSPAPVTPVTHTSAQPASPAQPAQPAQPAPLTNAPPAPLTNAQPAQPVKRGRIISAGHDTACAAACADGLFISSGTWSIAGVAAAEPIISEDAKEAGVSVEIGTDGKPLLLRNITGFWILQQLRREMGDIPYAQMEEMASEYPAMRHIIDPDAPVFAADGAMAPRIEEYCGKSLTPGELIRCFYDSLALKYHEVINKMEELTGKTFGTVTILGGGTQCTPLLEATRDITGREIITGHTEAAAFGNAIIQKKYTALKL